MYDIPNLQGSLGYQGQQTCQATPVCLLMFKCLPCFCVRQALYVLNMKIDSKFSATADLFVLLLTLLQPDDPHLLTFCELMGAPLKEMSHWLCHRKLKTAAETYNKPVPRVQAVNARNALAKHVYARLFGWIVARINAALQTVGTQHAFIGVLDIYGWVRLTPSAALLEHA